MSTFLGRVADDVLERFGHDLSGICFVLPGRRAGLHLRKELGKRLKKPVEAPEFLPIQQFFERLDGRKPADRITLLFELYLCYLEFRKEQAEPFETYITWGETALADYNEIDNYLVDPRQLFINLKSIKDIEEWSLGEEHLSPEQEAYLKFWEELGDLYHHFQERLEQKGLVYAGMQKKAIAARMPELSGEIPWKHVIIAGMNALSASEQKLFFGLEKAGKASLYWDADTFYTEDTRHEAGKFLRHYKEVLGSLNGLSDDFLHAERRIQVHGAASQVAQAKSAGDLLAGSTADDLRTAVVLADESMLLPVLHSLPSSVDSLNVTMGYPLKLTPLMSLNDAVVRLHLNASRQRRGKGRFYYKDILAVLRNPYIRRLLDHDDAERSEALIKALRNGRMVYPSTRDLVRISGEAIQERIGFIFQEYHETTEILGLLDQMNHSLAADAASHEDALANEYLFRFDELLGTLRSYLDKYPFAAHIDVLLKLMRQLIATESVAFYGEPLQGLQILGMLETRALDFDKVILLGANEDLLPKPKFDPSFIPFDLKLAFGLPTFRERDAIYAYYFFRLLSRAKEVDIFYNAQPGDFGAGERSRFIAQLDFHLQQSEAPFRVKEELIQSPMSPFVANSLEILSNEDIRQRLDRWLSNGISPSALNTLIQCPLDFYFKYVAGMKEAEEMEENIEASTFGSVIHEALEQLYKPHLGEYLSTVAIRNMFGKVDEELHKAFSTHYSEEEILYGSNQLSFQVARTYMRRFLQMELDFLKQCEVERTPVMLLALETSYECTLDLAPYGFEKVVKFKGNADRVDKVGDKIRIIDYKTGSVESSDLNLLKRGSDSLLEKPKAVQLMLYLMMYSESTSTPTDQLSAGIISLRKLSNGFMELIADQDPETIEEFKRNLAEALAELYHVDKVFTHSPGSKFCKFCS